MKISNISIIIILLNFILFSFCKANDVEKIKLPDNFVIKNNCGFNQFNTKFECFSLVAGDKVKLRNEPNTKSKIIKILPLSLRVHVLYVSNEKLVIDGNYGSFALVSLPSMKNKPIGWIFDYYLCSKNQFVHYKNENIKSFKYTIGDSNNNYAFYPDGSFINNNTYTCDTNKTGVCNTIYKGKLFKFRNLIWARKVKDDDYINIFIIKDDKLLIEDKYSHDTKYME